MIVSVDMNYLRSLGMAIYKDLNEAINLNPKAKEKFILLRSPEGKIELYPDEIVKGKVLHYIQIMNRHGFNRHLGVIFGLTPPR